MRLGRGHQLQLLNKKGPPDSRHLLKKYKTICEEVMLKITNLHFIKPLDVITHSSEIGIEEYLFSMHRKRQILIHYL